jgi:hypothetical protein
LINPLDVVGFTGTFKASVIIIFKPNLSFTIWNNIKYNDLYWSA